MGILGLVQPLLTHHGQFLDCGSDSGTVKHVTSDLPIPENEVSNIEPAKFRHFAKGCTYNTII